MLVGARRAVLGVRPWWLSAKWMSSAGDKPAAIIDANRDRYALPTLGTTLINPASWQMSVIPTGTATNSPSGTLTIAGDGGSGFGIADYQVATVAGASYCVEYTVATNGCSFSVGTAQSGSDLFPVAGAQSGSYVRIFTATTATSWIRFIRGGAGNSVVTAITAKLISLTTLRPAAFAECLSVSATRSGTASTYVDSDGLMKSLATSDVPRFTWLGGKRRLVVEPASTNLMTYSQDANNAIWVKTNCTVSPDVAIAPDGTLTADKIISNLGATGFLAQSNPYSFTSGSPVTMSRFYRADEISSALFLVSNGAFGGTGANGTCEFYLSTLTVVANRADVMGSIMPYGNGWYRCAMTIVPTATATANIQWDRAIAAGDGVSGIYAWGAQLETLAYATSYIPTAAGTVARAAEIVTGSALLTALHRRATGTHVMRYLQQDDPVLAPARQTLWSMNMDFGNSRLSVRKAPSAGAEGPQGAVGNGSSVSSLTAGSGLGADAGESIGAVLAWDASSSRLAVKGALAGGSDGGGWDAASNSASVFYIGRNSDGTTPSAMLIDQDLIYPVRVSNTALPGLAVRAA